MKNSHLQIQTRDRSSCIGAFRPGPGQRLPCSPESRSEAFSFWPSTPRCSQYQRCRRWSLKGGPSWSPVKIVIVRKILNTHFIFINHRVTRCPGFPMKNQVLSHISKYLYNWVIRLSSSSVLSRENNLIKGSQAHCKTKLSSNHNLLSPDLELVKVGKMESL